jgi:hypothetical protein
MAAQPDEEKMKKDFGKATGLKVVDMPQPPQGQTTFAIDKNKNGKKR